MTGFSTIAFQSALNIAAILLGVFGFLFSVYVTLSVNQVARPPLIWRIIRICKAVSILSLLNFLIAAAALYAFRDQLTDVADIPLALGLMLIVMLSVGISLWMAFTMK